MLGGERVAAGVGGNAVAAISDTEGEVVGEGVAVDVGGDVAAELSITVEVAVESNVAVQATASDMMPRAIDKSIRESLMENLCCFILDCQGDYTIPSHLALARKSALIPDTS